MNKTSLIPVNFHQQFKQQNNYLSSCHSLVEMKSYSDLVWFFLARLAILSMTLLLLHLMEPKKQQIFYDHFHCSLVIVVRETIASKYLNVLKVPCSIVFKNYSTNFIINEWTLSFHHGTTQCFSYTNRFYRVFSSVIELFIC